MAIQKYDVRRPDGTFEERFWSPVNSPVLRTDGKLEYVIHRVEDVTEFVHQKAEAGSNDKTLRTRMERMEAEIFRSSQEIQLVNQQLRAVNAELEAFSYSVSHDLRAPLRHIDAFTKILLDDFASEIPPDAVRYLNTIRKGSQNMSQLVDDLLNLARVGRQELKHELTPLNTIVDEVVTELTRDTPQRQIEWHIGELPAVNGDPGLVKQVFANLLSNAVKYTRPRKKAVIEIGARDVNGERVIFVQDNGVGFNMKYADKLFGVFQRLHRTEEFEGTGVGLAIVDRVVRRHGGHIWAESELGKGATFYFTLNGLDKPAKRGEPVKA
jgi:light-regulated signal transduction histidine kinase (bacteriophytochrome)